MDLNIIEKTMKVGPKKDQKMYGLARVSTPNVHSKTIAEQVGKSTTFSEADTRHIIKEFIDVIIDRVADGYVVDMGELGTLRPTITAKSVDTRQECKASTITDKGIRYIARNEFSAEIKGMSLRVLNTAGGTASSPSDPDDGGGDTPGGGSGTDNPGSGNTPGGSGQGGSDLEG